jgi:hypothetical protein
MTGPIITSLLGAILLIIFQCEIKDFLGNDLFGAVLGAYFAFTFFVIGKGVDIVLEKKRRNFVSIVQIQHLCVSILHALAWNMQELRNLKKSLDTKGFSKDKSLDLAFYLIQPRLIELDKSIVLYLKNLEFLQDSFNMMLTFEDTNAIMQSTCEGNERFDKQYMHKPVDAKTLQSRVALLTTELKTLERTAERTKDVLAKSRVLIKIAREFILFKKSKYTEKEQRLFDKERVEINKHNFDYEEQDVGPKESI